MLKVLITGGAGFIGSHLTAYLLAKGFTVRILDTLSPQVHGEVPHGLNWIDNSHIEFIRGSVTNRHVVERAIHGVSAVVHLAAETGTGQSMYEIEHYNFINSHGTAMLLDALASSKSHNVSRFILASSRSVYGEGAYINPISNVRVHPLSRLPVNLAACRWNPVCDSTGSDLIPVPTLETDPVRPASVYASTKFAQEDLTRIVCQSSDISYAILRLQNVYGEGQSLKNPYTGILSIFSTRIRRGIQLPIFEDGLESRDFVHVQDVVSSIFAALTCSQPLNNIVNVGSGIGTTVLDVARELMVALDHEVPIRITGEYRVGDIRHNIADINRLSNLIPGGPQISLREGLKRFAVWVKSQPLPADLLDNANNQLRERKLMV